MSSEQTQQTTEPVTDAAADAAVRDEAIALMGGDEDTTPPATSDPPAPAPEAPPAEATATPPAEGDAYWRELAQLKKENRELKQSQRPQDAITLDALKAYDPNKLAEALGWDENTLVNVLTSRYTDTPRPDEQPAAAQPLTAEDVQRMVEEGIAKGLQPLQQQLTMVELAPIVAQKPQQYEMILQSPKENLELVIATANKLGVPASDPSVLDEVEGLLLEFETKRLERNRGASKLQKYFAQTNGGTPAAATPPATPPAPAIAGPNGAPPAPREQTDAELRNECIAMLDDE